jgi:hypothetical protein
MYIVSNTGITAKNTCDAQHGYMYTEELEPIIYPLHIRRGIAGHKVLETYYLARQQGLDHASAVQEAMATLIGIIGQADPEDIDEQHMLGHLSWLLIEYFKFYEDDKFKVISVETAYSAPFNGIYQISFGMILDVVVEMTTGAFRGYYNIMDHKFVNNFLSPDDLRLNAQQPKYHKVAQLNGMPVKDAIFNQIRYRKMKYPSGTDLFRRSPLLSNSTAIGTVWKEAQQTAVDIYEEETGGRLPNRRRRQSYSNCKYCFFKDLCMAELNGQDTTVMRKAQYQKRSRPLKDWMLSNA